MDSNNFTNIIQQGFRVAVGATASAVETLQDKEKINQKIDELNREFQEKSKLWEEKGAITEEEAKRVIEQFFNKQKNSTNYDSENTSDFNVTSDRQPPTTQDIRNLTEEIISLREELNKIKNPH
jgi:polyhydroxyalkanoate synthesis regulator phasin